MRLKVTAVFPMSNRVEFLDLDTNTIQYWKGTEKSDVRSFKIGETYKLKDSVFNRIETEFLESLNTFREDLETIAKAEGVK